MNTIIADDISSFVDTISNMPYMKKKAPRKKPEWRLKGYDSGFEYNVHQNTPKIDYHKHDKISYTVEYTYEPDFSWPTSDTGKPLLVETKGDPSKWDRKKFLSFYNQYSDRYEIKLLFQKDVRIPGCKKLTMSGWAKKHGIDYAIGTKIPTHWLG